MKITLIIPSLQPGGAERVLSVMANYWADLLHQVTVLTFTPADEPPFFSLKNTVGYQPLTLLKHSTNVVSAVANNLWRLMVLRKAVKKSQPDVVISFLTETNILTLCATRWLRIRVIVSEHNDPYKIPLPRSWTVLRKIAYPWADRIVVLTNDAKYFFEPKLQKKTIVIPNPLTTPPIDGSRVISGRKKLILAMGRLHPQKGFDILLRSFSALPAEVADWNLMVIGEGPQRTKLEDLAEQLGIEGRVEFPGIIEDSAALLRRAGLFVLSSRYEGFPMSLCEAMANGCPVIATKYSNSVFDIIAPGNNGIVIPPNDSKALSDALLMLIYDDNLRNKLGTGAKIIVERFGTSKVMRAWDDLILEATKKNSGLRRDRAQSHSH